VKQHHRNAEAICKQLNAGEKGGRGSLTIQHGETRSAFPFAAQHAVQSKTTHIHSVQPLSLDAGYEEAKPMVFCGLFPTDADQYNDMREALGRLQLNDAALSFEPEVTPFLPPSSPLLLGQSSLRQKIDTLRVAPPPPPHPFWIRGTNFQ